MAQYNIVINRPSGAMDIKSIYYSLTSNNKEILRGTLNVTSNKGVFLKALTLGGTLDFNMLAPSGEKVGYARKVISIPSYFEIYKEPENLLVAKVQAQMGLLASNWAIYDPQNQQMAVIKGSINPLAFVHKIYDASGNNEIGSFTLDLKTKIRTIVCNDPKLTPLIILGTWLCLNSDTGSKGPIL